jgi:hypothetical protein
MSEWTEQYDESGNAYYVNSITGESSWEKPPGWDVAGKTVEMKQAGDLSAEVSSKGDVDSKTGVKKRKTKEEREAEKAARLQRRAEQMEKKRVRDLERAKKKAIEDEIERKRLAEEARLKKIQELQEAWNSVQYSLLNLKQQRSLAGKGIRAVKNESPGGIKIFLAEVGIYKGGYEDENGVRHDSINVKDYNLNTPLHWAAKLGNVGYVNKFLKAGMDPRTLNASGLNAFHLSISGGHTECALALLLDGQIDPMKPSEGLKCKSLLSSGFRCPNEQKDGGYCENKVCKERGNDMLMEAMKKAKDKKVKFDIAEFNKQDDDDIQHKTPLQIALRRKSPAIYSVLESYDLGGKEMAAALKQFQNATRVEDVRAACEEISAAISRRRSVNETEKAKNKVTRRTRGDLEYPIAWPLYETMACWKALLSAALEDPDSNVYGHQMRFALALATKWHQLTNLKRKLFTRRDWDECEGLLNTVEEIYDKFGDIYDLYRKKSDDLLDETKIELGHDPFESKTDNLVVDEDDEDRSSKNSSSDEKSLLR